MCELQRKCSPFLFSASLALAGFLSLSGLAQGQLINVDQEIGVHDLPSMLAPSRHSSDVLATSLATIIHDSEVCCRKDSALEFSVERADPKSLQDVATRLNGRHVLGDGRSVMVKAEFLPADKANAGYLIGAMTTQHAMLMQWNSHIYVIHGLIYLWMASGGSPDRSPDTGGALTTVVHKFLLWDTGYSDSRREVVFNRDTDDLSKVQGFLFVDVKPQ